MANGSRSTRFGSDLDDFSKSRGHVRSRVDEKPFWDTLSEPRGTRKTFDSAPSKKDARRKSPFHSLRGLKIES